MSGFFGMVRSDGAPVSHEFLDLILRALEFRGSDGSRMWAKDGVGFCFTFFDTRARYQSPAQPVQLGDRFWLVGDVRLDARADLISDLQAKQQPASAETSNEELLVMAWELWAEDALARISGDFAFGLWDAREQALYCARDFAGARPFYYAQGRGIFCFSNTLQGLPMVPELSCGLDEFFVRDFLLTGLPRDPERTVWREVRRLPVGHRLKYANGKLDVKRFLELPIEEPLRLAHPEEYLEGFRELMERAVADRLPEGKLSLYLSGGLDSATVSATAVKIASDQGTSSELKAFTVSWRPLIEDAEPDFAKVTAQSLGLDHKILEEQVILADQDANSVATPEPSGDLFLGRALRFYRTIASHSRVVLAGDGGDDVLEGQAWPYLRYLAKRGAWGEILSRWGDYLFAHRQIPPLRGGFRSRMKRWIYRANQPKKIPTWLDPEFEKRTRPQSAGPTPAALLPIHPFHPRAYRSLHSGYWATVLEEEDAGWTSVPLETRAPFLDLRLVRFLLRLPPVPWCMHKELTRAAMADRLPAVILKRGKSPLPGDPLEACQTSQQRPLELPQNPPKIFREFIKWESWRATLESSTGSLFCENLYPLSFLRWLKDIEKQRGIQ
jgi:asparagine synthase (glutamine-hydrolysing)